MPQYASLGIGSSNEGNDPHDLESLSLAGVAQLYEERFHREGLEAQLVRLCAHRFPANVFPQHELLASVRQFRFIITTNWDRLIEKAYHSSQSSLSRSAFVVRSSADIPHIDASRVSVIKIHGDFDLDDKRFVSKPRITDADLRSLEREEPALFNHLKTLFTSHRVVVIGFRPTDYNFLRLYDFVTLSLHGTMRQICFVDPAPPLVPDFKQRDYIPITAADFLGYVKTHSDYLGGAAGFASRVTEVQTGSVAYWARTQCKRASELLKIFPQILRAEVVLPSENADPAELTSRDARKESVGRRAADLLKDTAKEGCSIALSCGSTLRILAQMADPNWSKFRRCKIMSTSVAAFDDCNVLAPYGLITFFHSTNATAGSDWTGVSVAVGVL
ncbi:hypothetical protein RAS1_30080 [Phycisphaerae bacterium RAS1]|nr:hypothetical protein RAS1_30080 [Phycisphaerae bacterium RAS1]